MRPVGLLLFETWANTVPTSVAPPNTSSAKAAASGAQAPDPQTFPGATLCFTPVGTHGHRHLLHPPERDRVSWHNLVMYGMKPADVIQKLRQEGQPHFMLSVTLPIGRGPIRTS
jgi:hypothetical protein